ncbi:DUF4388 domain-containing protein [Desulfobotulus sp.]|jgi:hypothetical protein|uniref:DUF4388 domain-containing protein n=1 Tax=Desulfobotulus sp. TaxID=1940337 RepID=UPI002A360CFE|nr:DUF4388 domain-containing protein [Desulfobotulus sp.]MDY0161968.1 DUF4388 domain-containing protein [Desulfobotulus sp.]
MASSPGGKIQGISLPAFLQMIQMEKSTCTLTVQGKRSTGRLFIRDGEVIDAQYADLAALEAAYEILCLPDPVIHMEKDCAHTQRQIRVPMMHLLMEGTRRFDERASRISDEEDADFFPQVSPEPPPCVPESFQGPGAPNSPQHHADTPGWETEDPDLSGLAAYEFSDEEFRQATQPDFTQQLSLDATEKTDPLPKKKSPKKTGRTRKPASPASAPATVKPSFSRKKAALFLVSILTLATLMTLGGLYAYRIYQHQDAYARLQEALGRLELPEQREAVLSRFLASFPQSRHAPDLQKTRDQLRDLILERDYQDLLTEESSLSQTPESFDKALRLYERFLVSHPQGDKANAVRTLQENRILAMAHYLASRGRETPAEAQWLEEVRNFTSRFPESPGIQALQESLLMRGNIHMEHIFTLPAQTSQARSQIIALASDFIQNFPGHPGRTRVGEYLDHLHREDRIAAFRAAASQMPDHADQLRFYERARREEKDPLVQPFLQERITELRQRVDEDRIWEQVLTDLRRPGLTDPARIALLDRYLMENPPERHRMEAQKERTRMAERMEAQEKQAREERARQTALALQRQQEEERARRAAARLRLENAQREMNQRLTQVHERFRNLGNGVMQDTRTQKIWMLVDAEAYTGSCLDFEGARNFVQQLELGGYRDWRLPTENELAVLFKNPPAYPLPYPDRWYWTSEIFSRGYQNEVRVVTARAENILQRQNRSPENCGHTLAIRP